MVVNNDIDVIILRGEERTAELNSKYEGLNLEDLNNFKSDASVQQWEGEDFRAVCCYFPATSLFLAEIGISEKTAELQSTLIVEAGTKIQLFRRQLFQGYSSRRSIQGRKGTQNTQGTKTDSHVS